MCELVNIERHIFDIFRDVQSDIMNEPDIVAEELTSSTELDGAQDDGESVWTDYESEEDEDEDEESEDDGFYACHETLAKPCFELEKQFDPCAICFEDIKMVNMMVTRCGHIFHASCMFEAIAASPNCPLCRTELVCSCPSESSSAETEEAEVVVAWTIDRTPSQL